MTLRRTRVSNPKERIADELSKQILSEMEKQIQEREDVEPREKDKAISIVRKVFEDTEKALDVAFSAEVLISKVEDHAQEESLKYSSSLPESQMKKELNKARKRLSKTSMLILELLNIEYKDEEIPAGTNSFFYHWFEDDLTFADKAENLVKYFEDTMKRSLTLAITKVSLDPTSLGARPKDTYVYKNQTKQIPNSDT